MRNILIITMALIMLLSITLQTYAITFWDIPNDAWYKNYVYSLVEDSVINGYPDGTFKPNNKVTAGEFIKLIVMASAPDVNYELVSSSFNHWSAKYVRVAENYGVLNVGEYDLRNIDNEISRMEIVRILVRCDLLIRETPQTSDFKQFTDIENLTEDELIYLSHAVGIGVINGDPEGTFRPNDGLRRSECSKVICMYTNR